MFRNNKSPVCKSLLLLLSAIVTLAAGFVVAAVEDDIRERLQPHGVVCVFGDPCAAGMVASTTGSGEPLAPEEVYQKYCVACHATGVNNSPVMGNVEQWAPRIAKGIDTLYESAVNGFNNNLMPPKGLCVECSVEDIHATVDYIIEASQ